MDELIDIQKKIIPDLLEVMQKRYTILQHINVMEPVGRRSLAINLGFTERVLRSEVEFLKEQNLIQISSLGMSMTEEGKAILERLEMMMIEVSEIKGLEKQLQEKMGIAKVVVVSGDSDVMPWVKKELGRACAAWMKKCIKSNDIIAVTGGTTMAATAEMMTPELGDKNPLFVPARGGVGQNINHQANVICSLMAKVTNSAHKVFYVPDQVSEGIYESFLKEPPIQEMLQLIKSASIVLHGIGDAITMAERRNTEANEMKKIIDGRGVGEAFGTYFNEYGDIVHKTQTIGLQVKDLQNIRDVIAVAGGASKGKAIYAYMKQAPRHTVLITDEGAAKTLSRLDWQ